MVVTRKRLGPLALGALFLVLGLGWLSLGHYLVAALFAVAGAGWVIIGALQWSKADA